MYRWKSLPRIKTEDIPGIISYLNKEDIKIEETKMKNTFDTIYGNPDC